MEDSHLSAQRCRHLATWLWSGECAGPSPTQHAPGGLPATCSFQPFDPPPTSPQGSSHGPASRVDQVSAPAERIPSPRCPAELPLPPAASELRAPVHLRVGPWPRWRDSVTDFTSRPGDPGGWALLSQEAEASVSPQAEEGPADRNSVLLLSHPDLAAAGPHCTVRALTWVTMEGWPRSRPAVCPGRGVAGRDGTRAQWGLGGHS